MIRQLEILALFNKEYTIMPWMGTTIRGVFGYALRKASCNKRKNYPCSKCLDRYTCAYQILFETKADLFEVMPIGKKLEGITKPYTLSNLRMLDHVRFKFYITLIGDYAKSNENVIVNAIYNMAQMGLGRCKKTNQKRIFNVLKVNSFNFLRDEREQIYEPDDGYSYAYGDRATDIFETDLNAKALEYFHKKPSIIKLEFKVPFMLIKDGKTANEIAISLILKNIMRKISFVKTYYLDQKPLSLDHVKAIINLSDMIKLDSSFLKERWLTKYSFERLQWEKIGPFYEGILIYRIPEVLYKEDLAVKIFEYLLWGKLLHIGKLATAGAGDYELYLY